VNELYPDIDDSSVVPRALLRVSLKDSAIHSRYAAVNRAVHWISDMQGMNGGWAAFDRDNNMRILAHVPFADFMTPLDPTSVDVTAHVLELLAEAGRVDTSFQRALSYLVKQQEADGAWYGRWGVNYVYGTGSALEAFGAAGAVNGQPTDSTVQTSSRPGDRRSISRGIRQAIDLAVLRGVSWLESCQNPDGGWGETCASYDDPRLKGIGRSTPSQTAWALMGLIAAGKGQSNSVRRGVGYLLDNQKDNGSWAEELYTGTGFPGAFYLRYDLYRIYFPLLALSRYLKSVITVETKKSTDSFENENFTSESEKRLASIDPAERILLMPHCLRLSDRCQAGYGKRGLECKECSPECSVFKLKREAEEMGYKGVCIAPGGKLALKYISETRPQGIVAVACQQELDEGVEAVAGKSTGEGYSPVIYVIPLTKDGCVDTEVNVELALKKVALGC
jgi:hypothetical protein